MEKVNEYSLDNQGLESLKQHQESLTSLQVVCRFHMIRRKATEHLNTLEVFERINDVLSELQNKYQSKIDLTEDQFCQITFETPSETERNSWLRYLAKKISYDLVETYLVDSAICYCKDRPIHITHLCPEKKMDIDQHFL